jgi:hypothetical protein
MLRCCWLTGTHEACVFFNLAPSALYWNFLCRRRSAWLVVESNKLRQPKCSTHFLPRSLRLNSFWVLPHPHTAPCWKVTTMTSKSIRGDGHKILFLRVDWLNKMRTIIYVLILQVDTQQTTSNLDSIIVIFFRPPQSFFIPDIIGLFPHEKVLHAFLFLLI